MIDELQILDEWIEVSEDKESMQYFAPRKPALKTDERTHILGLFSEYRRTSKS